MQHLLKVWDRLEESIAMALFCALIIFGVLQVVSRFGIIDMALDWTEELSRYAFIALVYISASLAIARKRHVRVEVIDMLLPASWRKKLELVVNVIWMIFNVIIAHAGWVVAVEGMTTTTPVLQWNMGYLYLIIPFTFILMAFRILFRIIQDVREARLPEGPATEGGM
ncbi:TRAP transporter small permease [Desulfovibrio sp. OttesenSCG-928-I05]|nr:TRAP transporter small permease [Desulfovibrio sp. OttesenSCG-928-I05]